MIDVPRFLEAGYAPTASLMRGRTLVALTDAADRVQVDAGGARAGVRDVLRREEAFQDLADSPAVRSIVEPILGPAAFVVRSILFDKTPDANWDVVWHQDVTIAVQERHEVAGFGPWSMKAACRTCSRQRRCLRR